MKILIKRLKFITFTISKTVDVVQELKNIFRVNKNKFTKKIKKLPGQQTVRRREHQKTAKIDNLGHKKCIKNQFYVTSSKLRHTKASK